MRQASEEASTAFTRKATRMPPTIMSWFSEEIAPRIWVGAISERYSGTTSAAQPTAMPRTNRPASSTPTVGARAATSAPTVKITPAAMMSVRRPRRSESGPASAAPSIAPSRSEATTAPSMNEERSKSSLMKRMAPEMTPVS